MERTSARTIVHVNGSPRARGLSRALIAAWAADILRREGREGEVSITFVDTRAMTALNERYTKRTGTTDVLAFSQQEGDHPPPDPYLLGDVVVDVERVRAQAREVGVPWREELLRVVCHGILHLLGYDHASPKEQSRMHSAQERHLLAFGRRNRDASG